MMVIFFAGFVGSNLAGLLADFCGGLKLIGIFAISSGKILTSIREKFSFFFNLGIALFVLFEYILIADMPFWSVILSGAVFSMSLNMTIPVFFNYGGELIYPEGEAHSIGVRKVKET